MSYIALNTAASGMNAYLLTGDDPSLLADTLHELIHELLAGEDRDEQGLQTHDERGHAHRQADVDSDEDSAEVDRVQEYADKGGLGVLPAVTYPRSTQRDHEEGEDSCRQ